MNLHPDTLRRLTRADMAAFGVQAIDFWMSPAFESQLAIGKPVDYAPFVTLCQEEQDPETIGVVLQLTMEQIRRNEGYRDKEHIEKLYMEWMNAFTQPARLRLPRNPDFIPYPHWNEIGADLQTPAPYMWGATIGFFRCALWLDQKGHARFIEQLFPLIVTEMVYYQWWHGYKADHGAVKDESRSKLSAAIKAYVRSGVRHTKPRATVIATLKSVLSMQHERFRLTDLSRDIIDQLIYALFGDVSVEERLRAMVLAFDGPLAHLIQPTGVH